MKKEELVAMGLTDEQAQKVVDVYSESIKGFIPKNRFDEVNEAKKDLEQQVKDRDKQLKDLGDKVKGNDEAEKTIKELQEANKKTKDEYEAKIKNMTIDTAIMSKLNDAKHPDLLAGKFDKSKIEIGPDGALIGIDEQLKALKDTYKDLFTPEVKGSTPNNTGVGQLPKGEKQKLEALINDPKTPLAQRVAAKNQLFNLESEE